MNDTLKQEEVAVPDNKQPQPKKEKYVPPTIEVIQVKTERGYSVSLGDRPNHNW